MQQAARDKMQRKQVAWMAVNHVSDAGKEDCQITLMHDKDTVVLPRLPKSAAAKRILETIISHETGESL